MLEKWVQNQKSRLWVDETFRTKYSRMTQVKGCLSSSNFTWSILEYNGLQFIPKAIFMTFTENSSLVMNDTQGPRKYPHNRENLHGHTSICNIAIKLLWCFHLLTRSLVATSKYGLPTIRRHSATRKHLFVYLKDNGSGLKKQTKKKEYLSALLATITDVHLPK